MSYGLQKYCHGRSLVNFNERSSIQCVGVQTFEKSMVLRLLDLQTCCAKRFRILHDVNRSKVYAG
jgi:hypothetical protein